MGLKRDLIGEALELGRSLKKQAKQISPAKIAKTAAEQVSGQASVTDAPPGLEDLKGKKPTPTQMQKMRQNDNSRRSKELNSARIALKREMIRRYKKMQQEILKQEKEREQESLKRQQEEIEIMKKKQEEQEKQGEQIVQPKRTKKKGFLGIFQRQKKGSKELGKVRAG